MPHSFTNIWIHLIFSTKDRQLLISESFESKLHNHIKAKLINEYESYVEAINGTSDHMHILYKQSPNFSLKDIVKNIKGESSHWINENNFTKEKFVWQSGYSAFSISIDKVKIVKKYIDNQKKHHKKIIFIDEIKKFLKIYGFDDKTVETV
ncbi:MAG: IS200/IS605 family transposase [Ignavibacteriae bacterium]|nr:IS200/IS605 family transposase [Ignavibacteriota bacterium]